MGDCGWARDCEAALAFTCVASLMRFCTRVELAPDACLCIHLDTGEGSEWGVMLTCRRLYRC